MPDFSNFSNQWILSIIFKKYIRYALDKPGIRNNQKTDIRNTSQKRSRTKMVNNQKTPQQPRLTRGASIIYVCWQTRGSGCQTNVKNTTESFVVPGVDVKYLVSAVVFCQNLAYLLKIISMLLIKNEINWLFSQFWCNKKIGFNENALKFSKKSRNLIFKTLAWKKNSGFFPRSGNFFNLEY